LVRGRKTKTKTDLPSEPSPETTFNSYSLEVSEVALFTYLFILIILVDGLAFMKPWPPHSDHSFQIVEYSFF
jgi:hypothetical protein